jgi:hypothetical protein
MAHRHWILQALLRARQFLTMLMLVGEEHDLAKKQRKDSINTEIYSCK